MEHLDYGPFWHAYDFNTQHAAMETPMLHIGGWYDTFCQGTIDSYVGLKQNARTKVARDSARLESLILAKRCSRWIHSKLKSVGSITGSETSTTVWMTNHQFEYS